MIKLGMEMSLQLSIEEFPAKGKKLKDQRSTKQTRDGAMKKVSTQES